MGSMGIQQKIAWFYVERSRPLSEMGSWSGSLPRNGLGKQTNEGLYSWKEIKKASKL